MTSYKNTQYTSSYKMSISFLYFAKYLTLKHTYFSMFTFINRKSHALCYKELTVKFNIMVGPIKWLLWKLCYVLRCYSDFLVT